MLPSFVYVARGIRVSALLPSCLAALRVHQQMRESAHLDISCIAWLNKYFCRFWQVLIRLSQRYQIRAVSDIRIPTPVIPATVLHSLQSLRTFVGFKAQKYR